MPDMKNFRERIKAFLNKRKEEYERAYKEYYQEKAESGGDDEPDTDGHGR